MHMPVRLLFGSEDHSYREFLMAQSGPLADVVASGTVEVDVLPGEVHGFEHVDAQEAVLESIRRWALDPPVAPTLKSGKDRTIAETIAERSRKP